MSASDKNPQPLEKEVRPTSAVDQAAGESATSRATQSSLASDGFRRLMDTIVDRRDHPSGPSYTAKLLAGGDELIGRKVKEEAGELVEAAEMLTQATQNPNTTFEKPGYGTRGHVVYEAADLLYHMWVLLAAHRVELDEVEAELDRRAGTSGLVEKANRGTPNKQDATE